MKSEISCFLTLRNTGSDSDSLTLSEACWLSWGVLLNSGMNEGTPRSLSSRVLTLIWAGFAMILLASYTANLAAFLVLEEHTDTITGITDPKLRNPSENFTFGTVAGSSVDTYFRQKIELSNMYRVMNRSNVGSAEEGVNALLNGSLKAFIWDSSRLEYEASRDCNLVTVGDLFGRSGYGIGLTRGSPWADKITLDILHFHESGLMAKLDDQWIWSDLEKDCPLESNGEPLQLGLTNIEGMFFMVVGATITGTILVFIEICCKRLSVKKAVKKRALVRLASTKEPGCEVNSDEDIPLEELLDDFDIPEVAMFDHKCWGGVVQNGNQHKFRHKRDTQSKGKFSKKVGDARPDTSLQRIGERLSNSSNLPWECKNWTDSEWLKYYLHKVEEKIDGASEISDYSTLASSVHARKVLLEMAKAAENNDENNLCKIQVKKMAHVLPNDRLATPLDDRSLVSQSETSENSTSRYFTVQGEFHHQQPAGEKNLVNENKFALTETDVQSPTGSVAETVETFCPVHCGENNVELLEGFCNIKVECENFAFTQEHRQDFDASACEINNDILPDIVGFSVTKDE